MADLIDRQQEIDAVDDYIGTFDAIDVNFLDGLKTAKKLMMQLPSAQPEQKKGKWEKVYLDHVASGERPSIFYCSSCNQCVPYPTNFCPACGSDNRQR